MHLSGHRAIRALAVFLVLALGVAALLPLIVRGANQVTGFISTSATITPSVAAYNTSNPTGRTQLIMTNTTNAAGLANLTLWPAVFLIRASAPDLETDQSVDVSLTSSTTINLVAGPRIFGHVLDSSNNPLDAVVAWLYNPAAPNSSAYRLIPATVSGSLYDIHAPAGTYTLIVDADHFLSHKASVTLPTTNPNDLVLQAAPPELYQTTVGYGAN